MSALTRQRSSFEQVPSDLNIQYYTQRADFGMILTECTSVSLQGNSFLYAAGMYNQQHMENWKKVIDSVKAKNPEAVMVLQLYHCGRVRIEQLFKDGLKPISCSATRVRGIERNSQQEYEVAQEMTLEQIEQVKEEFRQSAILAKQAGFDGIELHGANGYLVDQFLKTSSNLRTDKYGGSIENRCRFCLEVIDVLTGVFGAGKVGIKLSPTGRYQDMHDDNALESNKYLLQQLDKRDIAFVEIKESGKFDDNKFFEHEQYNIKEAIKELKPFYKGNIIGNEQFTFEKGNQYMEQGLIQAASFGRYAINNPDLVNRFKNNYPLDEQWDYKTWFTQNEQGYTTYQNYQQ